MIINIIIIILLGISSFMDIKYRKISTRLLIVFGTAAILILAEKMYRNGIVEIGRMFIGILPGLLLLLFGKITSESIGYGDGYIFVIIGIYIGFIRTVGILITALFLSALISIFLLSIRKINRHTELPFIPVVLISYFIQCIL